MEKPARSDAVKFFLHILETDSYSSFNFKPTLYSHFQRILGTPDKVLLLTDANFSAKVNPSRRYPACEIDTANLFDEAGDPIFKLGEPCSPDPTATSYNFYQKTKGPKTQVSIELCA